jgi:hypothetical protein
MCIVVSEGEALYLGYKSVAPAAVPSVLSALQTLNFADCGVLKNVKPCSLWDSCTNIEDNLINLNIVQSSTAQYVIKFDMLQYKVEHFTVFSSRLYV